MLLTDAGLWIGSGNSDGASVYAGICFLPWP
jgi:hypothetical protein